MLNRFKTLLILFSLSALLLPNWAEAKKLNVITATTDLASLAQEVGGDKIQRRIHCQGLPGPALRGGQAQFSAEAPPG